MSITVYKSRHAAQQGFALVVIATLFIAFSVIAAVAVERSTVSGQIERQVKAKDQLSRIATALIQYSLVNKKSTVLNSFPCPASPKLHMTDANFGVPVSHCETGTPADLDLLPNGLATDYVVRGMVPVRALVDYGIDVNDAIDPWNARVMYIVRKNLTPEAAESDAPEPRSTSAGLLTVTSFVAAPNVTHAGDDAPLHPDFILISYGADREGGYMKSRIDISYACASGGRKDINCANNTTTFTRGPIYTATNATATLGQPTDYFDDILTYYSR